VTGAAAAPAPAPAEGPSGAPGPAEGPSGAPGPAEGPSGVPGPTVLWSVSPSRRSIVFAWVLRLLIRPFIAVSALVSGLGVRFGPGGIEMWRLWARVHEVNDLVGSISRPQRGTALQRIRLARCRAEYVRAVGVTAGGRAILYFHGGGFVAGGLGTYRRFAAKLSAASGATVLNVGYRMLPRSPITRAVEDGVDGYRRLLADGYAPDDIVLGGDSAGGGLAILVARAILEHGLPRPAGIVAISPWAELDPTDKLTHPAARTDPVIPIRSAAWLVETLVQRGLPLDPNLSAVNVDLAGLPPSLIHVGTTEVFTVDAVMLANALARAGVPVTLKHWQGQVHVFQVLGADLLPEARTALREIGEFVRAVSSAGDGTGSVSRRPCPPGG
jgi:acetyl esterase/lipase